MRRLIIALILGLCVPVSLAGTPEYKPFAEARVTAEQWHSYRESVHTAHGDTLRVFPEEYLEILHSQDLVLHFAFTLPGHPAHPAWITRRATGGVVDQVGYFAGDVAPFAELFRAYLDLTERNIEAASDEDPRPRPESSGGKPDDA
ncbi:hypothetical protein [Thioalkalivibrio sp. XN8]|uniref:hypothetical protein n=1 Tax=Thioalkalivibrio sp. XN8 TaxID=2712863 RepID=UPI0013EAF36A|nr:hypothetical protein [Thioalkalivibrio sp. XN8]NGP52505.1 hypothetical protein [Thioalkalivibrio sp. XN8]